MESAVDVVLGVVGAYVRQLVFVLGPLAVLGTLLFFVIRRTQRLMMETFGWSAVVYSTGWLGTPVHELAHVVVGKLFGIKIVEFKLFRPDPNSGVLGYVNYEVPERRLKSLPQLVGTFFMGVAPLFVGSGLIMLAFALLIRPEIDGRYHVAFLQLTQRVSVGDFSAAGQALGGVVHALFGEIFSPGWYSAWQRWLFLYLALAIGAHLAPSKADMKGGRIGFLVLLGLGLLANVVAAIAQADAAAATEAMSRALSPLACLLFLVLLLNTAHLALAQALALVVKRGAP